MVVMHLLKEENKLINKYPEIAAQYDTERNDEPLNKVYAAGRKKYWWKCPKCGKSWQAATYNRTINGTGCPFCSNPVYRKADVSYCLATHRAEVLPFWDYEKNKELGYTPWNVNPYSAKKFWWICPTNPEHRYYARIGQKCTICRKEKREAREKLARERAERKRLREERKEKL